MKLHKILPIIFLIIAMMISCSQETVINENISGEATTPDTKICVNIKTENSRTVRPEITKWEITVTNKSDANLTFSRTIDGKATSATFVNVTDGEYDITVRGIHEDSNRKTIILTANPTFEVKPNTVNVCEIIPEDNFDTSTRKGILDITVKISGLKDLFPDDKPITAEITNNSESKSTNLTFNSEKTELTGKITEIIPGSYKIEISNSKNLNLVKDPVVNIYPETTTEINWEWNYDSDEINTDQKLKGIKIPVWNKSTEGNIDSTPIGYGEAWIIPARNGYLTANALFAEPIWDDKSYNFELTIESTDEEGKTTTKYTSEIPASEFDFINCAYDDNRGLWVLSGTKSITSFYDENGNPYNDGQIFCYVLKNLSTGDDYKFSCSDSLAQDFTVATIEGKEYLFVISSSQILYAELKKDETVEITNFFKDTGLSSNLGNITTLYINSTTIYIATTLRGNANIYTGTISTGDTLTLDININQPLLSLGISDFTAGAIQNSEFLNYAFMISDMYINGSKLYVTAGCVCYNQDLGNGAEYHSFGGLFEYTFGDNGELKTNEITKKPEVIRYGVYDGDNGNNPFTTYNSKTFPIIIQATSDDSEYFAGPRYIIPSGNDLLIVDSGFYGVYTTPNDIPPLTDCEKRNRIFTFNIKENNDESEGLKFNSLTTLDDSISFDYDYLTSSLLY